MMWPQLQVVAQIVIGRVLDSLPEGLLIALFSWVMLRVLPRQNSGTRFAVWFVALLAVAALPVAGVPFAGSIVGGHSFPGAESIRPLITLSSPWSLILFLVWMMAASAAMLRLAAGIWQLRALRNGCIPINHADLDPAIRKTLADFTSSHAVALASSERMSVPAAIGFFKPMIVMPAWALRELTPSELNIVLLHEVAHVRRGDAWTNLLQKVVRALFPFHPAVWWIERRLSLEREMACDDQVLAQTANPRTYATCLITLLEKSVARRGWSMAQAVVHRAREASLRIAQILDAARPTTRNIWKPALSLVSIFSLFCLAVAPRAPRFVAFAPDTPLFQAGNAGLAPLTSPRIPAAAVVPASFHGRSSSGPRKIQLASSRTIARLPEHRSSGPRMIPARSSTELERSPAPAKLNQTAMPASETLLIIHTAQQVGPNSWVWSVGVWHVTMLNAVPAEAEKTPITKKI